MNTKNIQTQNLGYPRIGERRELKKSLEAYWKGTLTQSELLKTGSEIRKLNWLKQKNAGVDLIPSNDFSFYDQVLDHSLMLGNIPNRFHRSSENPSLDDLFLIARGIRDSKSEPSSCSCSEHSGGASEMTKWFDTNYHYIVPEFNHQTTFRFSSQKVIHEFQEALSLGIKTKPVLLGPVTYLTLGKVHDKENPSFNRFELFDQILPVYQNILKALQEAGVEWIQIDEPILSLDLSAEQKTLLFKSHETLREKAPNLKIIIANYFGELRENLDLACKLQCDVLHIDAIRAPLEVSLVAEKIPLSRKLSLGVIDGRNIWKNDYQASLQIIHQVTQSIGTDRIFIAPSCSLIHVPVTLRNEVQLRTEIQNWLAFADEKLIELQDLQKLAQNRSFEGLLEKNQVEHHVRRTHPLIHRREVKERLDKIQPQDYKRLSPFPNRQIVQRKKLNLPLFPTTTIGSFPQTSEVRSLRARWKKGALDHAEYTAQIQQEILRCVEFQDALGIDVPVHGEFERNDMVEYFGEQLEGFTFTDNGWVQSYGSRCVKPPIIYGDVSRPHPMTVEWSTYAQSLTKRPMKGMLTGPITILQWSFVRNDQPRSTTTRQIALAIRDEVADLEKAGITVIQIDEPAIREGLPLRRADWSHYLQWATESFRLCSSCVKDSTQIHTHMCYSEFNDIIQAIADLDADVITIETSRSNMELLEAFVNFKYPAEIGPGVYDIHSPRVPNIKEIESLIQKAIQVLPIHNIWINPDCGLKTRGWNEVKESLNNMIQATHRLRAQYSNSKLLV